MTTLPNPLIPGFNPDPSVVAVDGVYYLVTSTFEYLPGMPVYRSTDLVDWEQIGAVATRESQTGVGTAATNLGVWAPTIRHHDGRFHVIVTIAAGEKGCVVFTADDPAGPWSDGLTIEGIGGIDPDLAWDDEGNAYVTFSGLLLVGEDMGKHLGVQQARVDLDAGRTLEAPRSLWSGTGLQFPEAPHVFRRGEHWYLMIAEGGTERGHGVSIARGPSIEGPFVGAPVNPVLSARSTTRPIQNTGHADLVTAPDGSDVLVLLGMRPQGGTRAFSPLGRETFATPVTWVDGWPQPAPVALAPRDEPFAERLDLTDPAVLEDPAWITPRRMPADVATPTEAGLEFVGDGDMDSFRPAFVGRRQRHLTSSTSVVADVTDGAGGIATRYDDETWFGLEARRGDGGVTVTATASIPTLRQSWTAVLPVGPVLLRMDTAPPPGGFSSAAMGGDRVRLSAAVGDTEVLLTELDGRSWSAESATSFTGRVTGMVAAEGTVRFTGWRYDGTEQRAERPLGQED